MEWVLKRADSRKLNDKGGRRPTLARGGSSLSVEVVSRKRARWSIRRERQQVIDGGYRDAPGGAVARFAADAVPADRDTLRAMLDAEAAEEG